MKDLGKISRIRTGFTLATALLILTACNLDSGKDKFQPNEVICIHDLQLRPGADAKEFESFVMKELAPLYNQMQGQQLFLAKGDRGIRNGQYALIITLVSVENRDRIYPPDIGFSEEFTEIMEGKEEMWDKFSSMAEGFDGSSHTDYVVVRQ